MKKTRVLQGRITTLFTAVLVTMLDPAAYASDHVPGSVQVLEAGQGLSPFPIAQVSANDQADSATSSLTPEAAAEIVKTAILRGEASSLVSTFGQLSLSSPRQTGDQQLEVTAAYTLFPEEGQFAEEEPIESPGNMQASLDSQPQAQATDPELAVPMAENLQFEEPSPALDGPGSRPSPSTLVLNLTLAGTVDQVTNAATFLAVAMVKGTYLDHAEAGASLVMAGVNYGVTVDLMEVLPTILTIDPAEPDTADLDIESLTTAISLYNQILHDNSAATVYALAENPYFLEIGNALRVIRDSL